MCSVCHCVKRLVTGLGPAVGSCVYSEKCDLLISKCDFSAMGLRIDIYKQGREFNECRKVVKSVIKCGIV